MCTVTYLPKNDGCLITANRDETVFRGIAHAPEVRIYQGVEVLTPKDPLAGGTWIAASKSMATCLYNGAFEPHKRKPPYRMSRGYVPLQCLAAGSIDGFVEQFDPSGIEPFSLLVFDGQRLVELKWDENQLHRMDHDPARPHIWASVPLYSKEVRLQREVWFSEWLEKEPEFTEEEILQFHSQRDKGSKENGLLIERDQGLRTVSVTSMRFSGQGELHMTHMDLVDDHTTKAAMK